MMTTSGKRNEKPQYLSYDYNCSICSNDVFIVYDSFRRCTVCQSEVVFKVNAILTKPHDGTGDINE